VDSKKQPSGQAAALPDVMRGKRQLGEDDRFSFECHSQLSCFNLCCADVNIMLTPVDVLRLSRKLGMSTTDFLATHTQRPITKDLHLPVVMLKMRDDDEKRCPFVGDQGCTVYGDRPWACRMYPVGMGLPPARAGVEPKPVYFLFEDDFCRGHASSKPWTVAKWRDDQSVPAREELEQGFRDIVGHPWFIGGTRQLDPKRIELFYMAAFDLDTFRSFIFGSTFLKRFDIEPDLVEKLRVNDEELLRFGFRWLRYALFSEPTMTMRPDAPAPRKATAP
jgi:Fe-S-cluster containining protein